MKPIPDSAIDAVLDELDDYEEDRYAETADAFAQAQPYVFAYLTNEENFHLLTEEERGYVEYLSLVVWMTITRVHGSIPVVDVEQIGQAEERNYELLETAPAHRFEERIETFFDHTDQPALLRFAIEAVTEDDEEEENLVITPEGRETGFVAVKTVIDVLTQS